MSGSNNWIFGAIFNVIATKYKLYPKHSRVLFHSNEIPVDMLAERYPFFTHHGGIVLYLYSGSMSLPISYRKTGKNVSIEKLQTVISLQQKRCPNFCHGCLWNVLSKTYLSRTATKRVICTPNYCRISQCSIILLPLCMWTMQLLRSFLIPYRKTYSQHQHTTATTQMLLHLILLTVMTSGRQLTVFPQYIQDQTNPSLDTTYQ